MLIENKIKYYTLSDIAFMLGISEKSVSNKISTLKIKKSKTHGPYGNFLYTFDQLEILKVDKRFKNSEIELPYEKLLYQNYQTPIVITYYIYESKMNNPENTL